MPAATAKIEATCHECGETFIQKRKDQTFCCKECRVSFNSRRASRGAALYDMLMAKRFGMAPGKGRGVDAEQDGGLSEADLRKLMDSFASYWAEEDTERVGTKHAPTGAQRCGDIREHPDYVAVRLCKVAGRKYTV